MPASDRKDCCVAAAVFVAGGKFGAADDVALQRCASDQNNCCVAAAAFGAGGKFNAADDVALQRCVNVATTGFVCF